MKYMSDVYDKPWCRIGPYAVGLILGYILHVTRGKYTMTKVGVCGGGIMILIVIQMQIFPARSIKQRKCLTVVIQTFTHTPPPLPSPPPPPHTHTPRSPFLRANI